MPDLRAIYGEFCSPYHFSLPPKQCIQPAAQISFHMMMLLGVRGMRRCRNVIRTYVTSVCTFEMDFLIFLLLPRTKDEEGCCPLYENWGGGRDAVCLRLCTIINGGR